MVRNPPEYSSKVIPTIGLSSEEIVVGYRLILGREPENEDVIIEHQKLGSVEALRNTLLRSAEFAKKYAEMTEKDPYIRTRYAYRAILGRWPESETEVNTTAKLGSLDEVRTSLINSRSFAHQFAALKRAEAARPNDLDARRVLFMHIPKTGGTSVHEALLPNFNKDDICPERWNGLFRYTLGELSHFRLFSGHFDYHACLMVPGRRNQIFTMLREPKARILSLYYFERAHRGDIIEKQSLKLAQLARRHNLLDFLTSDEVRQHSSVRDGIANALTGRAQQGRWECASVPQHEDDIDISDSEKLSAARQNLEDLTAFGILERFEESLGHIFARLGLKRPEVVKKKMVVDEIVQTDPGMEPVTVEPITPDIDAALDQLTMVDRPLYAHACALLDHMLASDERQE